MSLKPVGPPAPEERIIFIPEISNWGGGERVLLSLSKFLHGRNIPHRIVSYRQTCDLQPYADWPVVMEAIDPERHWLRNPQALKRYVETLRRSRSPRPLLVGIQAALHAGMMGLHDHALMILDTPSLLTAQKHTGVKRAATRLRDGLSARLIRRSLRRADSVLITTKVMAQECEDLYGFRPKVCYQGVPGDPACYTYRSPSEPLRMLSVCRLEANKRIDWILRTLGALEKATPPLHCTADWRLDIVGVGSQDEALRRMTADLGLSERVVFHGGVSDAELERCYAAADLFLMPAVQGYGLPALEALTRHIPVLLHRQSGVSEVLGGSAWAEIIAGGEESLGKGLAALLARIQSSVLEHTPLPNFPTEASWANEVCKQCHWT